MVPQVPNEAPSPHPLAIRNSKDGVRPITASSLYCVRARFERRAKQLQSWERAMPSGDFCAQLKAEREPVLAWLAVRWHGHTGTGADC